MIYVKKVLNGSAIISDFVCEIHGGGWFRVPDELVTQLRGCMPYPVLTIDEENATVSAIEAGSAPEQIEDSEQISSENVLLEMAADHEERLCMLELASI